MKRKSWRHRSWLGRAWSVFTSAYVLAPLLTFVGSQVVQIDAEGAWKLLTVLPGALLLMGAGWRLGYDAGYWRGYEACQITALEAKIMQHFDRGCGSDE